MNMKDKGSQGDFRGSISVVVVTYNQEKFLTKSLRSVFDQTRMPDEVIVVDNGSTDATRQIIKEYRDKISYIRNKKNLGAVCAFNQGLAAASSDYVILLSADDWFCETILEEEGRVLDKHSQIAVVYSQAYTWQNEKRKLIVAAPAGQKTVIGRDEFERLLTQGDFIPLLTALIRRSSYEKLGLMDEKIKFRHDWEFWIKLAKAYRFAYLAKPLAYWRLHESYGVSSPDFVKSFKYDFGYILRKHLPKKDKKLRKLRVKAYQYYYLALFGQEVAVGKFNEGLKFWWRSFNLKPFFFGLIFLPIPFCWYIKRNLSRLKSCFSKH